MSETGEDSGYFAAAEAAFIRRRGTPFLLSPKDFALLTEWRSLGVPIEAIEQGIDDAFARREERGAAGRVNSLSYCRDAVLLAWERRAEAAIGRGTGRSAEEPEASSALTALAARLSELASVRPELEPALKSAAKSVSRLAASGKDPAAAEDALARLDKRLAGALYDALPAPERERVDAEVSAQLARARVRLDDETAEKTARALRRRAVREALSVPRLSLL
ncbi:MAG: hypothetical protein ABI914_04935 [Acidobacteriota bacterium]